ncbi:MAG: hypothetical protein L0216_15440 [Planctomycetales bacterium]|nr:hypothetical protein [Planctomycetales bacterium]
MPEPRAPLAPTAPEWTPLLGLSETARGTGGLVLGKAEFLTRPRRAATPERVASEILMQWTGGLDALVCGLDRPEWFERLARSLSPKLPWMQVVGVRVEGGDGSSGPPPVIAARIVVVPAWEAQRAADRLLETEGLAVGPRAGANVLAARAVAGQIGPRAVVLAILPDRGPLAAPAPGW